MQLVTLMCQGREEYPNRRTRLRKTSCSGSGSYLHLFQEDVFRSGDRAWSTAQPFRHNSWGQLLGVLAGVGVCLSKNQNGVQSHVEAGCVRIVNHALQKGR